jgi:hypothetical protein
MISYTLIARFKVHNPHGISNVATMNILETDIPLIIVKPMVNLNMNKVHNIQQKAKSIILTTKGRTNIKLTLERDGFNHP